MDGVVTFGAGDIVFAEGSVGREFYIVIAGTVGICRTVNGERRVLHTLGPSDMFGELALIDPVPRAADAIALSVDTRLLAVDRARFLYLVSQQPGFALMVMETMSKWIRPVPTDVKTASSLDGHRQADVQGHLMPKSPSEMFVTHSVADGIYQIRSRSRSGNVYVFQGRAQTILVDAGLGVCFDGLVLALASLGIPPTSIDRIILTHEHCDHVSAVPKFVHKPHVSAHALAASKLDNLDTFGMMQGAFNEPVVPFTINTHLSHGQVIDTGTHSLHVLHTPGHTSGCISLYEPNMKVLATGDALMAGGAMGGILGSGNISDSIYSLELMAGLGANVLLPGHGAISTQAAVDIDKTLQRSRALLAETRQIFDTLHASESINKIILSIRDLNR
jgi:hydroxyacylglutathione hydrolase